MNANEMFRHCRDNLAIWSLLMCADLEFDKTTNRKALLRCKKAMVVQSGMMMNPFDIV